MIHVYTFCDVISVGGTYKVSDIPSYMKTSFVKLSKGEVPPGVSPEKSVVISGSKGIYYCFESKKTKKQKKKQKKKTTKNKKNKTTTTKKKKQQQQQKKQQQQKNSTIY